MDFSQVASKNKKNSPLILSVLNAPPKSQLKQVASPSSQYSLYAYSQKKIMLAAYKTMIPKSKLLSNLQTYQWRCQTQFPIVKTAFVYVKQNQNSTASTVQITAYNQHCPLKLTQIYEMPAGQVLYLLKQSIIGFDRLYNRFGSFQILNSMITINQKGFCRVWLNQNFALNTFPKRDITQSKMIHKIITIMESHSQESKLSKKLFNSLRNCTTFLNAIRSIDAFVKQQKIFVPSKFISLSSSKEISRVQTPILGKQSQSQSDSPNLISRFSIKDEKFNKFRQIIKQEMKKSIKERKTSFSPLQIKRLKSEKSITAQEPTNKMMKVSDQQTFHTKKRTGNAQLFCSSPTSVKMGQRKQEKEKKRPGWIQESSYIMGDDQNLSKDYGIKKKQMTQSQAFNFGQELIRTNFNNSERKYSCKLSPSKNKNFKTNNAFNKKNANQPYFGQFQNILSSDEKQSPTRKKKVQDIDQEKLRSQVSGSVLKNNGWVAKVSGLLDMPANLQQSFHEGQEESTVAKQVKLDKLNSVGRQQMLMSVLHQQFEDLL